MSDTASDVNGKSTRPTPLRVNAAGIPAELKALDRWVVWRYEWRRGKWTKPPFNARTGNKADSTDPSTCAPFAAARACYEAGGWDGIGLVHLYTDCITGIDFDDCRDPASGQLAPWCAAILSELDTYAEVSPSGEGARAYARGVKP